MVKNIMSSLSKMKRCVLKGGVKTTPAIGNEIKIKKNWKKNTALRDLASVQIDHEITALRDLLILQHTVFKGVIAQITGALRDNIGSEVRFFYDKGKEISDTGFEVIRSSLTRREITHEAQKNHRSETTTACSEAI